MGYLEIGLAGLIWATTGPLLRILQKRGFTPWDIVLGRALFAIFFMGTVLLWRRRHGHKGNGETENLVPSAQDFPTFLALGFLAVVFSQTTYFYALSVTSVAVAVTLNYTAPFFVMIICYFLYGEKLTGQKILALVTALLGVALVSGLLTPEKGTMTASLPGILAGLVSGAAYGSQTVVYKKVGVKYGPLPLNFWTMATGTPALILTLTISKGQAPEFFTKLAHATPGSWLIFLLLGLGPGTLAFIFFADGINKVEATRGSIVAMSEPVAACILGYFILGETLTWTELLGVGLVLGAIWSVSLPLASRARRSTGQSCS
ncbi:MAG: EamA family transporter [Candidatus Fermentithermobacillus carboniphilus]|uniref:EamA family transporter n=1 Tax=Candidatus Fermentithermobacillus carboniphilus TaxID=3085328 RepID=A0AAT9LAH6_9FIRM|nr:MAG: EamA family transporter [Candidatus Fermentithermobacillus carboniphilus]